MNMSWHSCPSLISILRFLQIMPRPWVDDLQSWTQIALISALDGLTTCTTPRGGTTACPYWHIVTLFVLLLLILQGRYRTGVLITFLQSNCYSEADASPDQNNDELLLLQQMRRRRGTLFHRTAAGLSYVIIYTLHTYHVASHHIMTENAIRTHKMPSTVQLCFVFLIGSKGSQTVLMVR